MSEVRIASLLPAATEIAGAVGLADALVAVTFECDEPAGVRDRVPVVVTSALPAGLTPAEIDAVVRERSAARRPLYDLDAATLRAAAPDLILTQDLCRVCALPAGTVTDALDALGCTADVLSVDPHTVDAVLAAIAEVGRRGGAAGPAAALVAALRARL
ncbi:MAG: cobalamin-binding protein, partial [Pseudonocardiales bacterium]|nr:cobalamin-binding protein [Pseudonocardiales bacterium]